MRVAAEACTHGQTVMLQQSRMQRDQQQAAGAATGTLSWAAKQAANQAAHKAAAQLAAAVLKQLLRECRSLPSNLESSSSSSSNNRNTTRIQLLQSCQDIATTLMSIVQFATVEAAKKPVPTESAASPEQQSGSNIQQQPVPHAKCCKLLQECVRLVAAAPAPAPALFQSMQWFASRLLGYVAMLLRSVQYQSGSPFQTVSGDLVAPVASAGDVSSPGALQLLGLLCSLLKVYNTGGCSSSSSTTSTGATTCTTTGTTTTNGSSSSSNTTSTNVALTATGMACLQAAVLLTRGMSAPQ